MSWLFEIKFWLKLSKYPSVASNCVIQSFSQTISQMSCGHKIMLNSITYLNISRLEGDDLVDDTLEISF